LQASWALLNVVEDREPSPQFTARVMAKLRPDPLRAGVSRLPSLGSRGFRWAALAAAAAVIVLVVAGVLDREPIKAPSNGSEVVADLELVESEELLQHLDVVQDLDLLLLMDEG
jgi:anti-sigma-K factor RskA